MIKPSIILLAGIGSTGMAATPQGDATAVALTRCLDDAANASTAGQTQCEVDAARAYDRRMNAAYAILMRTLPRPAAQTLRQTQQAWLAFRDAESKARGALFATRQGTMYVPMQAAGATVIVRDRALQLESDARIVAIDS
ncbi:lysozyme inhibitor LprI family protein [Sphingomonas sp. So64.6b]|uniref:lysozyme inhibitor LprI family protein n=1 Tax=Sphingomonas sp. So64.6b TaxID=2997354 RepID=UPI001603431E|nr:lysozyme inhibitor LprI family protein [Sphingomonas sp. So64.6b]